MTAPRRCFVIAEAGVNHNGNVERALNLVDVAADAGADAVKFQTFRAEALASAAAGRAQYQNKNLGETGSQVSMLRGLELSFDAHRAVNERCRERNIEFMSTAFDLQSLEFLLKELGLSRIKVSSGDATNAPFLLELARCGKPLLVSTGMCTLAEVEQALTVLAFGLTRSGARPSRAGFAAAYASVEGQMLLRERVTLLHCVTEYPAPVAAVNLQAMNTLVAAFGLQVGYSDHTEGIAVALASVARGAAVLEKHFTLDRTLPGPDHAASLEPEELRSLVRGVREIEAAIGSGIKAPAPCELANLVAARRSLVAARDLKAGDRFKPEDIVVKRPGSGAMPIQLWEKLGQVIDRDYSADEVIEP
jgi:N-acetylneuraminate synthase